MAKLSLLAGTTSKSVKVFIQDTSKTTGAGLAGLTASSSGLTAYSIREGAGASAAVSLASATLGTWISGGFVAVDAVNMPGLYELSIPNAVLAAGAKSAIVYLQGAANMAPVILELELTAIDNQNAASGGLSNLDANVGSRSTYAGGAVASVTGNVGGNVVGNVAGSVASVTAPVAITSNVKTGQALSGFVFLMTDASTHQPKVGCSVSASRSLNGGAYAACTNASTELGYGLYSIALSAGDMNGSTVALRFTASGADDQNMTIVTQP